MADYAPVLSDIFAPFSGTMKSVNGLVLHHTGPYPSVEAVLLDWQTPRKGKTGDWYAGSQFIMDRDGTVYQTGPDGVKMNHAGSYNGTYEGLEVLADDDSDITPAQRAAFKAFAEWHADKNGYVIGVDTILTHGEIASKTGGGARRETEGATLKWGLMAQEGIPVPADVMVGDDGKGNPLMTFADAGFGIPQNSALTAASQLAVGGAMPPQPSLSGLLPAEAKYGVGVLRKPGDPVFVPSFDSDGAFGVGGIGSLNDPRTIAMLTPQQRLATINAVITPGKDVFIPLPTLGAPPMATIADFVPYQTLPPPPIAQLDQAAPGQTYAGQEGGNVITKPSAPTPAAPFTGSRPPITTVDTQPKPLTYEKGKTASGKEVDLGRVVLGSDGSPGAWNLNSKGVAVFVKNPPTVIDYLNAGGVVGDMAAAEVEKAKAAAGEAVSGAADAVKDKAGEIVGGVGGFLGDLLKPRAGVTTGDTGAQSPPTMMTKAPAPSISSKIILPLSTSKALDFPSLGITSAAKPPVISTPAAVVPYFGETMNIPPIPAAVAKPLPVVNTPMQDYLSGNVGYTPTGGALAGAAGVGGAVASTVLAAPVAAPPPVVMRPVVRDNSPIAAGDYTIKWGETLEQISARSGISVAEIAAQNGIGNINSIAEGQRLRIGMAPVVARGPVTRGRPAAAPGVAKPAGLAARSKSGPGYVASGPVGTKTPTTLVNAKGKALTLKNTTRYDAAAGKFVPYSYYTAY